MISLRRGRSSSLIPALLAIALLEVALNRLAITVLRPPDGAAPAAWQATLDRIALFLQYFASTLAIAILAEIAVELHAARRLYAVPARYALMVMTGAVAALGAATVVTAPGAGLTFALESAFSALLIVLVLAQLSRGGDRFAKLGVAVLAAPLLIHYYGPFASRYLAQKPAVWALPDQLQRLGQLSMAMAALASPYLLAPRPFLRGVARIGPAVAAISVGLIGALLLSSHYEVGMVLASRGLGIDLGPGAPTSLLALYVVALATMTWTLVSCLSSAAPARRQIGAGIGLVVAGGYGFAWPLPFLCSAVGLLAIGEAAGRVVAEERAAAEAAEAGFRAPPIPDPAWESYVEALVQALGSEPARANDGEERTSRGDGAQRAAAVTSRDQDGLSRTQVVLSRRSMPVRIRIERRDGAVACIDIACGGEPPAGVRPAFNLEAKPDRLLAHPVHPAPPRVEAAPKKSGDDTFDRRFRIRDAGAHAPRLFDEALRARATALLDGWLAFWPGAEQQLPALEHRIYPGRGAPLDHPIPITELAFRGTGAPTATERLITLLDLLVDIARRGAGRG